MSVMKSMIQIKIYNFEFPWFLSLFFNVFQSTLFLLKSFSKDILNVSPIFIILSISG